MRSSGDDSSDIVERAADPDKDSGIEAIFVAADPFFLFFVAKSDKDDIGFLDQVLNILEGSIIGNSILINLAAILSKIDFEIRETIGQVLSSGFGYAIISANQTNGVTLVGRELD